LVAAPFDWLAQAMGAAAGWLFEAVWSVFDTTTLVDVTSPATSASTTCCSASRCS
jgi:DNA processing protein